MENKDTNDFIKWIKIKEKEYKYYNRNFLKGFKDEVDIIKNLTIQYDYTTELKNKIRNELNNLRNKCGSCMNNSEDGQETAILICLSRLHEKKPLS